MAPLAQDEARSKIRGKIGSAILPASDTYWDMNKEFVTTKEPRQVGNVTGGSWQGVVSSLSDHPEATYAFWSLMAIKPVSKWLATYGWDGVDPGYSYQFPGAGRRGQRGLHQGRLGRRGRQAVISTPTIRTSTRR